LGQVSQGASRRSIPPLLLLTETTFYRWRAKYDGFQISDATRFRALEDENRRLKKLVADLSLGNAMLKVIVGRTW